MQHPLEPELRVAETRVWEALCAGDRAADMAMLSEDFLGVYPSGFSDRDGHGEMLDDGPTMQEYRLSEIKVMEVGNDYAMFSYRADYLRAGKSQWEIMYISSLWRRQDGGWINVFSQDTPKA